MQGINSLKNYQAKSNERMLLVLNDGGKLSESSEADLEAKGAIISYLDPGIQKDFNDIVQQRVVD